MKKIIRFGCLLLALLLLTACAPSDSADSEVLQIAAGTSTSQWYPIAAGICSYIDSFEAVAEVTSGGVEDGFIVGKQDMNFGFINSNAAYSARHGLWPYEEAYDVSAVALLYTCAVQIVVFEDSGIRTVDDLRGKRIILSPPGSSLYMAAVEILGEYDITEDDIDGVQMSYSEGVIAMRDGHCDAMIVIMPMPHSSITELSLVRDVRLIPIDKAALLAEKYPYFDADTVDLSVYPQSSLASSPVETVRLGVMLIANGATDDAQVEAVLQSIFDHKEQLGEIQAVAKGISLANAVNVPIPLHPAAERFYAQNGTERG